MTRKLATIQRISEIRDIPGAGNIQVAKILGWKTVIQKGQFQEGELVVYCEIDSWLPIRPEFEFLRKSSYKKNENGEGFRIKTAKFRGQVSQGICFPLSILWYGENLEISRNAIRKFQDEDFTEGIDFSDILGIRKFVPEIPANLRGIQKGSFPAFIPRTDETRVQLLQSVLTRHKGIECYFSEKVDGSSVTYYQKDSEFGVCSRNLELEEDENNLLWKMARKNNYSEKLERICRYLGINGCAIQGELIGPGIQGNNLKLDENEVQFFNVFDIQNYRYLNYYEFLDLGLSLDLNIVHILLQRYRLEDDIEKLVDMSKGNSAINPEVEREGIVIRPLFETFDLQMAQKFGNGRLSFKVCNPDYLLRFEDK